MFWFISLSSETTLKNSSDIFVIRHIITKIYIRIQFYCRTNFLNTLYVLGAQKNHLIETVLLNTHNICFG